MKLRALLFATSAALLAGCSVGPDYHQPAPVPLPMDWHWKKAEPKDDVAKGPWWELFHDSELNRLVEREPVLITQNGEPQFVAQSLDAFEDAADEQLMAGDRETSQTG